MYEIIPLISWYAIFSCDQAALRTLLSVHPPLTPFSQFFFSSDHHEIFRSYYHWQNWSPCKKSRSEVKGHRGQNKFSPIRAFLECNSSLNSQMATKCCTKLVMAQKRYPIVSWGHLSNFKVTRDKKSPFLTRIGGFWTVTRVWIYWWLWNDAQSLKQHRRGALLFFQGHPWNFKVTRGQNSQFWPKLGVSGL